MVDSLYGPVPENTVPQDPKDPSSLFGDEELYGAVAQQGPTTLPTIGAKDLAPSYLSPQQRMARNLAIKGAEIRTAGMLAKEYREQDPATRPIWRRGWSAETALKWDSAVAGLEEGWDMTISAFNGLGALFSENETQPWLTSEIYDELVQDQPEDIATLVMSATSEKDARKIVADKTHMNRLLQHHHYLAKEYGGETFDAFSTGLTMMSDPGMWATGFGAGAMAVRAGKLYKTTSRLAGALTNAGIMASVEGVTGLAYAGLAQHGNPTITNKEVRDWAVWGAGFGAVLGGVSGAWRANAWKKYIDLKNRIRAAHSEDVLSGLGPRGSALFNRLVNESDDYLRSVEDVIAEEKKLRLLQEEIGTAGVSGTRDLTKIIDDLAPSEYLKIYKEVNIQLALRAQVREAEFLLRRANAGHILSMGNIYDDLDLTLMRSDMKPLEVAQAQLLKETDLLGQKALNRVIDGDYAILSIEETKWLVKNTPEVFGVNGIDLEAVIKGKTRHAKDIKDMHGRNMRRRAERRALLANREFTVGDVVMTSDGRIGRISKINKLDEGVQDPTAPGGKYQVETMELMETRKILKEAQQRLKKLEEAVAKKKPGSKGQQTKQANQIKAHEQRIASLIDEVNLRAVDDVFDVPAAATARFMISEATEKLTKTKWATFKGARRGALEEGVTRWADGKLKGFTGSVMGQSVKVTSGKTLPKGAKGVWWSADIDGLKVHTDNWWKNAVDNGTVSAEEYARAVADGSVLHGKSATAIKGEIEEIARRRLMNDYQKRVLAQHRAEQLELSRASDPPNILDELAEGRVPDAIKRILPEGMSNDDIMRWAQREAKRPHEVKEALRKGKHVPEEQLKIGDETVSPAERSLEELGAEAGKLDPYVRVMAGYLGHNMWGLSSEVGAVRKLYSLVYGSWFALTDPISGAALAAGGAADSLLAGGMMNFNRMQAKSFMSSFREVFLKEISVYRRATSQGFGKGKKAADRFNRHVKEYVEDANWSGTSLGSEADGAVKRAGDSYRKAIAEVLDWAKKNGVEELANVKPDKYYFPRFRKMAGMEEILSSPKGGRKAIEGLLMRSLKEGAALKGMPVMTDEVARLFAEKITKYYLSPAGTRAINDSLMGVRAADIDSFIEELDSILARGGKDKSGTLGGLSDYEKSELKKQFGPGFAATGHAVNRIPLNMQTALPDLINGKTIKVSDLFETNVGASLERYTIDLISTAQKRQLLKQFWTDTYQPKRIEHLFSDIHSIATDMHRNPGEVGRQLELVRKFLENEPRFERGRVGAILAVTRQYATVLKLPGFVAAQLPEAFTATFSHGLFRSMSKHMPILNRMRNDAVNGKVTWKQAREYVHTHLGMGSVEHDMSLIYAQHELIEAGSSLISSNSLSGKLYGAQAYAIPRISKLSGFRQVNVYSDWVAHKNFTEFLIESAVEGNVKALSKKRLATLGVSQDDLIEIFDAMKQDGVITIEKIRGRPIHTLNTDLMDPTAAAKYRTMSAANIRQVVQRSLPWDQPAIILQGSVGGNVGEFLTQFRTFSMSSMSNHLARNVQAMDRFAFSNITTMFAGGLGTHYGMSYLHFHDDPAKLREQLEPDNWVKGALIRSGFMGLVPDLVDVVAKPLTGETFFSPTNKAMLLSIPALDTVRDVGKGMGLAYDMALGRPTMGKESYQFRKITPLTNLLYYRILAELFLPDDWPL